MTRTTCTDVCDYVIDVLCSGCSKSTSCVDLYEDVSDSSEFHEQLIECLGEAFERSKLYTLM
jgi:hypothetical protein